MSDNEVKCIHGIEGVNAVMECNASLRYAIDDALNALRQTCTYEAGDGYYISLCGYSYSASDDPQGWRFCPRCGGKIPTPMNTLNDNDPEFDPHG